MLSLKLPWASNSPQNAGKALGASWGSLCLSNVMLRTALQPAKAGLHTLDEASACEHLASPITVKVQAEEPD